MTIENSSLPRRGFIGLAVAASGAGLAAPALASTPESPAPRKRVLRFAHLTDIHLYSERRAPEGFRAALRHVQEAQREVELIVTGGDLVFDSFETSLGTARDRWDLFTRILKEECRIPIEHCLGNHDIWGWCHAKCGANGGESEYGTALARSALKLDGEWRSFDRGGWHFVVLNSISPHPGDGCGYLAQLSQAQRAWLESDLAATRLPAVVVSHAPIVSVTASMDGKSLSNKDLVNQVSGGLIHLDGPELHQVFRSSGRVKLVLSGHMHQIDRCEAHGITYCCDGAVCGGWWKEDPKHSAPSYAIVDLFDDGTFEHRMTEYGWVNAK